MYNTYDTQILRLSISKKSLENWLSRSTTSYLPPTNYLFILVYISVVYFNQNTLTDRPKTRIPNYP